MPTRLVTFNCYVSEHWKTHARLGTSKRCAVLGKPYGIKLQHSGTLDGHHLATTLFQRKRMTSLNKQRPKQARHIG